MINSITPTLPPPAFTPTERRLLRTWRRRYRQDRDLFSRQERARLCFVHWLYATGRLVP